MAIDLRRGWETFARGATKWTGRRQAFGIALAIVLVYRHGFAGAVPAAVLIPFLFLAAAFPGQLYSQFLATGSTLKNTGPFEIFTYWPLAQDVKRMASANEAVVVTDGYGFSSQMDFEAGIPPVVIGYDWQGAESHNWITRIHGPRTALFVDKESLEERRGDLVRQVRDDAGERPRSGAEEVDLQGVREDDLHVLVAGERLFEQGDHPRVHLDRRHRPHPRGERRGQDAGSRTDLENIVLRGEVGGVDDRGQDSPVDEKSLPEGGRGTDPVATEHVAKRAAAGEVYPAFLRFTPQ